jgi:dephospho-CoA kinase
MSNYDYNLRLQSLRRTTTLIGVVGMTASGKTEFEKVVQEQGYAVFTHDRENVLKDTPLPVSEINTLPLNMQAEILKWDDSEFYDNLVATMSREYVVYEGVKNVIFDNHMNIISDQLKLALTHPSFLEDNDVVFVQCPLSTKFKYNDTFDAVITISRPMTYGTSWWVDVYADSMTPKYSREEAIGSLKHSDMLFNKLQIAEVAADIHNDGDLDTFKSNCKETIESVIDILSLR